MRLSSIGTATVLRNNLNFKLRNHIPSRSLTDMAPKYIKRITLFKIPKEEDIDRILAQYEELRRTAVKDGKPYIISNEAARTINISEERARGYTVCVQSTFASMEDVIYYDKECEAHKELKALVGTVRTDFATMLFESEMDPNSSKS